MGKTVVVTGGTGGIGYYSALGIAKAGHRVVITGRNPARGAEAVERLKGESGNDDIHLALGDLAQLSELQAFAEGLMARFPIIDVLLNNAGSLPTAPTTTDDGLEHGFAVNVVATYALTQALRPALRAAKGARVINVTGGLPTDDLDLDNLQGEKGFIALPTYSHSKRAMEALSMVQARALREEGIYLNVVYPGGASTAMTGAMTSKALPWWMRPFWPIFSLIMKRDDGGASAEKASRSSVWAATTPELEGVSGRYFDTQSRPARLKPQVSDPGNQQALKNRVGDLLKERALSFAL